MAESSEAIRNVLTTHFVMWRDLAATDGPPGEWRCECGQKFGFSHSAIAHVTEAVEAAVGARTERVWGVSLGNGIYETETRESALDLAHAASDIGPAVTCLRTTFRTSDTPWVEVDTADEAPAYEETR